jgi:alpha-beta hydrolase superfamily lysophospholipase
MTCLLLMACSPMLHPPGAKLTEPQLHAAHFVAPDGAILPVRAWLPEPGHTIKAVVMALHGFNDYSKAFAMAGPYFKTQDIALYAYDQRGFGLSTGHGLWAGTEAYVNDLVAFTATLRKRYPSVPIHVLGESMGGAVVISALTSKQPLKVDGVVLVAPAVWGRETMPWYQRALLSFCINTLPGLQLTGKGLHILPSDNLEMLRELGRDPLVIKATRVDAIYGLVNLMDEALKRSAQINHHHLLVLYGEKDEIIPKQPIFRMLKRIPKTSVIRVAIYEKGYHLLLRDLSAAKPWGDITAWIENQTQPLPSGADRRVTMVSAK